MNANYIVRYLFILFIILTTSYSSSQTINWQRAYRGPSGGYDYEARCLCKSDGSNFFLFIYDHMNDKNVYYKLNGYGDSLFAKILLNRSAKTCVSSGDGGAVVTGGTSYPTTVKINSWGNIVWDSMYYSGYNQTDCNNMIRTTDGCYIMIGGRSVVKIGSNSGFIWQKIFPTAFRLIYNNLIEAKDGGYILAGGVSDYINGPEFGILTKIDTSGVVIWEHRYTIDAPTKSYINFRIAELSNGYMAGGYYWNESLQRNCIALLNLDVYGNVNDTIKYSPYLNCDNYFADIKGISRDRVVVINHRHKDNYDSTLTNAFIANYKGNIKSFVEYAGASFTYLTYINIPDTNTIMFVGTSNHLNIYMEYPYVVKTDTTLYVPPISVRNITQLVPDKFYLNQNYPNPFNNSTQITFGIKKKGIYKLAVYDVTGKLIDELFNQNLESGEYKTDFNAEKLSSGIYFYRLESNKAIITKKLVLLK